jgi:hypothetical protein
MKILIFTEGTILMPLYGKDIDREKIVELSKAEGIQREERKIAFNSNSPIPLTPKGSSYDFANYIPIASAVEKISSWEKQGAEICYLTSRRMKVEIETIQKVLETFNFPNFSNLYYRQEGEDYKDVAEKLMPDILIEDDCESIGGEVEMTYPHIKSELKSKIKSIPIKEFNGIDNLPDQIADLT